QQVVDALGGAAAAVLALEFDLQTFAHQPLGARFQAADDAGPRRLVLVRRQADDRAPRARRTSRQRRQLAAPGAPTVGRLPRWKATSLFSSPSVRRTSVAWAGVP